MMKFTGVKKHPASNSTEECVYKGSNIHSLQISQQHETAVSRGLNEEGCDLRILCSAKLSLMCEAIKKTLSKMQWFRKYASFLCFLETAVRCISAD